MKIIINIDENKIKNNKYNIDANWIADRIESHVDDALDYGAIEKYLWDEDCDYETAEEIACSVGNAVDWEKI